MTTRLNSHCLYTKAFRMLFLKVIGHNKYIHGSANVEYILYSWPQLVILPLIPLAG